MNYAQAFIRVLVLVVCSLAINAHLEPRTAPLTPTELQDKGKARVMQKACKNLKKKGKHERFCTNIVA